MFGALGIASEEMNFLYLHTYQALFVVNRDSIIQVDKLFNQTCLFLLILCAEILFYLGLI